MTTTDRKVFCFPCSVGGKKAYSWLESGTLWLHRLKLLYSKLYKLYVGISEYKDAGRCVEQVWEPTVESSQQRGWGGVPLCCFTDRKQAGSVPTFLQQMFDRENIFTAGEGREGKYMFYDTSHWRWRKPRRKNLHMHDILLYMSICTVKAGPGKSRWTVRHCLLLIISHNSLGSCPVLLIGNLSINHSLSKNVG